MESSFCWSLLFGTICVAGCCRKCVLWSKRHPRHQQKSTCMCYLKLVRVLCREIGGIIGILCKSGKKDWRHRWLLLLYVNWLHASFRICTQRQNINGCDAGDYQRLGRGAGSSQWNGELSNDGCGVCMECVGWTCMRTLARACLHSTRSNDWPCQCATGPQQSQSQRLSVWIAEF